MNIHKQDADKVEIRSKAHKARDLLDGLIAHRNELGELGRELEQLLRAAGVEPSEQTDHIRHEYMPPLHPHPH